MVRVTLTVLTCLVFSTNNKAIVAPNIPPLINIEDGIAYSVDIESNIVYAYNNLTQELLKLEEYAFSVIDTVLFNPNVQFDPYYSTGQNKLSHEPKNIHFYYNPNTGQPMLLFWDSGLGRVHSYDINTRVLNRLDSSYDMRSFFGHGAFVDNDNLDIYTMGGYGEFVHKKNFLKFNPSFKEWVEIETGGKIPQEPLFGQLYFDDLRNRFLFVQRVWDMKIIIHELLKDGYTWNLLHEYEFDIDIRDAEVYSFPFSGNYSTIHPDWIAFHANFLFYLPENKLYQVNNPKISQEIYRTFSMHPVVGSDSVIIIGEKNKLNKELGLYKTSINDILEFTTPVSSASRSYLAYTLLLFLVFFLGLMFRYSRKQTQQNPQIIFNNNRSAASIKINNREIVFEEKLDLKFWELVESLLNQGLNSISYAEFDSYMFDEQYQPNQYTIKRTQLIEHINQRLKITFVKSRKEIHDKRYKRIVLDFSLLQ